MTINNQIYLNIHLYIIKDLSIIIIFIYLNNIIERVLMSFDVENFFLFPYYILHYALINKTIM